MPRHAPAIKPLPIEFAQKINHVIARQFLKRQPALLGKGREFAQIALVGRHRIGGQAFLDLCIGQESADQRLQLHLHDPWLNPAIFAA